MRRSIMPIPHSASNPDILARNPWRWRACLQDTPHSGAVRTSLCHNGQVPGPVSQASHAEHASLRGTSTPISFPSRPTIMDRIYWANPIPGVRHVPGPYHRPIAMPSNLVESLRLHLICHTEVSAFRLPTASHLEGMQVQESRVGRCR